MITWHKNKNRRREGGPLEDVEQHRRSAGWRGEGFAILLGHARSGTTVIARALGSHPDVGYWEEPALLATLEKRRPWLEDTARHLLADAGVSDLAGTARDGSLRDQFGAHLEVDEAEVSEVALTALRGLVDGYRREFLARSGGSVLLEKTPREIVLADQLPGWFPDARLIHIVRDGRDVVCSGLTWEERWGRPPWVPEQGPLLEVIARQWARQVASALHVGSPQTLLIKYEELAVNGHEIVAECLQHLGLARHERVDRFLESGMGGLHAGSVGRWREELSSAQIERIEEIAGDTLATAGYL